VRLKANQEPLVTSADVIDVDGPADELVEVVIARSCDRSKFPTLWSAQLYIIEQEEAEAQKKAQAHVQAVAQVQAEAQAQMQVDGQAQLQEQQQQNTHSSSSSSSRKENVLLPKKPPTMPTESATQLHLLKLRG
jgi:hypothetical protein